MSPPDEGSGPPPKVMGTLELENDFGPIRGLQYWTKPVKYKLWMQLWIEPEELQGGEVSSSQSSLVCFYWDGQQGWFDCVWRVSGSDLKLTETFLE